MMAGMSAPPPQAQQGPMPQAGPPQVAAPDSTGNMLQTAMTRMQNPSSNTIPQAPQQIPPGADHPMLRHVLQALGAFGQGFGYGAGTPAQQANNQEIEAKKAETMANLASTQAWHEGQLGLGQQKVGVAEQRALTAEQAVQNAQRRIDAYKELGEKRNNILQAKSEWEHEIAQGNLDNAISKVAQQYNEFQQGLAQKKDLFTTDMDYKNLALESGNYFKSAAQDIMRTALAQGGTAKAAEVMQKAAGTGLEHYMQEIIGNVPSGQNIMQQAQGSGMPGVASPAGAPGTPSPQAPPTPTGGPPMPPSQVSPQRPTPQAKASAKGGKAPTAQSGGAAPEGTIIKMADGSTQVKRNGQWVPNQ
jgi:hypothetical protein